MNSPNDVSLSPFTPLSAKHGAKQSFDEFKTPNIALDTSNLLNVHPGPKTPGSKSRDTAKVFLERDIVKKSTYQIVQDDSKPLLGDNPHLGPEQVYIPIPYKF